MNIFCQPCAAKPGWPFDVEKSFRHSCQRCFILTACNNYDEIVAQKSGVTAPVVPAPNKKDMVPKGKHAESVLPPAQKKDTRNETDKMLDAVQPNRKGIKLTTQVKGG